MQEEDKRPRTSPTIYDVAERAGVSISTVSLALNAPSRVRPDTLARVQTAIRDLRFVPKAEAVARAQRGTRRIGVVGRFSAIPSLSERLQGLLAEASKEGYEVVVYEHASVAFHPHLVDSLSLSRKLDGLILMDIPITDHLAHSLDADGLPTVLIEYPRPGLSCVVIDDVEGGRIVGRYLAERGHRHCAFLGLLAQPDSDLGFPSIDELRLQGFREGLAEAGLDLPERYVQRGFLPLATLEKEREVFQEVAREAARALLDTDPPPSAIFASFDLVAAVALSVIRERGLRIPENVAVVGFDDCEFASFLNLTTVRQHLAESGRVAFQLLCERMGADRPGVAKTVTLPLTLMRRSSA
jgi:DNA-binding LacI/PurR family transcriptional regulator